MHWGVILKFQKVSYSVTCSNVTVISVFSVLGGLGPTVTVIWTRSTQIKENSFPDDINETQSTVTVHWDIVIITTKSLRVNKHRADCNSALRHRNYHNKIIKSKQTSYWSVNIIISIIVYVEYQFAAAPALFVLNIVQAASTNLLFLFWSIPSPPKNENYWTERGRASIAPPLESTNAYKNAWESFS